jgi:sugar/nucleoside kinase (ribokinase family)
MHTDCELISLGDAAETNALEFNDGKLILSELSTFAELNWDRVKEQINLKHLAAKAAESALIALVDWCNLPHASDIWQGFYREIVAPNISHNPHFFFDLADPSKKAAGEVRQVLSIIDQFSGYGKVILGLNENEALKLTQFLGFEVNDHDEHQRLISIGRLLFDSMQIEQLVIHPIDGCFLINSTEELYLAGRMVDKPKVSTGGGDNFNAGFCFGLLNGFTELQSMVLAMATSGAYVQHGDSPDRESLGVYLKQWQQEL